MIWTNRIIQYPYFENNLPLEKPPVLVNVLNSIYTTEHGVKPRLLDIPVLCQKHVFDFSYPLSDNVDKNTFEQNWIRHFLMRRIGTETYSAFLIELISKINEIMPKYNIMFDALVENYNLFDGGSYKLSITEKENTNRDKTKENETNIDAEMNNDRTTHSEATSNGTTDNRFSDTPQNHISNVQDGEYITEYTYTETEAGTDTDGIIEDRGTEDRTVKENGTENEGVTRSFTRTESKETTINNKTETFLKFQSEIQSIYTMIYRECDDLFLQIM